MSSPLLSVCLITYNHAAFIKQAIESILMQKTSFEFEIIIADDCSTDGTTEIVKKYAAENPGKIIPLIQEKNIGAAENYVALLQAAKSKYIAYLEGDDYWLNDTKLEQQVMFLENNESYSLCFHQVYDLDNGKKKEIPTGEIPDTTDIKYLLSHSGYIVTLSIVYRNGPHIVDMIRKLIDCPFGDFITYVAAGQKGLLKFIPKYMGVHRKHASGTWSSLKFKEVFKKSLIGYRMLFNQLPAEQGNMLKVRYLLMLETYFLRDEAEFEEEEFKKLLIPEMQVEPYVIAYLKQNCEERKKLHHYISKVPFHILLKSMQYKLLNRLKGK